MTSSSKAPAPTLVSPHAPAPDSVPVPAPAPGVEEDEVSEVEYADEVKKEIPLLKRSILCIDGFSHKRLIQMSVLFSKAVKQKKSDFLACFPVYDYI